VVVVNGVVAHEDGVVAGRHGRVLLQPRLHGGHR
jgi:hypothetical protein